MVRCIARNPPISRPQETFEDTRDKTRACSSTRNRGEGTLRMFLERAALLVSSYDEGIRFFVDGLGFELLQDEAGVDEFAWN